MSAETMDFQGMVETIVGAVREHGGGIAVRLCDSKGVALQSGERQDSIRAIRKALVGREPLLLVMEDPGQPELVIISPVAEP